jgi:hypothetical protein
MSLPVSLALIREASHLLDLLGEPHFAERVLRPVFVWGIGLSTVWLIAAQSWKDARMKVVALILLAAAAFTIIPYLKLRRQSAATDELSRAVPSGQVTRLREESRWMFLTLAGLAATTVFLGNKGRIGTLLTFATISAGVALTGFSLWLEARDAGLTEPPRASPVMAVR